MRLYCPHCGQPIAAGDINLDRELAKCSSCNAVFSFRGALEPQRRRSSPRPRATLPRPKGVTIEETDSGLRIDRRWFRPVMIGLAIFCVFWDGFLLAWYGIAFEQNAPTMMFVFPLLHLAIGVALTYYAICTFVNHTVIDVGPEVTITHGPLPWPGNRRFGAGEIEQLYVRQRITYGRNGPHEHYEVRAVLAGGAMVPFVRGLSDAEEALYLEQVIENRLGLPDRPVPGEFGK